MDEFELEIKRDFLQEAKELLDNIEQSFLDLENDPGNKTLVDSIFRFAHNLKGTSRAVGFGHIAELTHVAENLLLEIKQDKIKVNGGIVSILLKFNDVVKHIIEGLQSNIEEVYDVHELVNELQAIINGEFSQTSPVMIEDEAIQAETILPPSAQDFPEEETEVQVDVQIEAVAEVIPLPQPEVVLKVAPKVEVKKEPRKDDETIRVSLARLDKLNDMVGELVILQSLVEESLNRTGQGKLARSLGKLCHYIQDTTMSLRMVPVGPTFQKLNRIVRDTSQLLNKKVDLIIVGEDTEIDKTVAESLGDPLVHIIRNAIDHGVELPADRMLSDKTEAGTVEVMAFHEGSFLVIQITDDGKGIDGEKLIAKAKGKGIIPQSANLTIQQGIELIFHPGFSTKDQVSEVSGRGVGMDVVKTNIEALGGEVKVRSIPGKGSCFRLMLPLTLAIIDGILIETSGQTYVLPKNQIQEVVRMDAKNVDKHTGRVPYFTLRGEVMPLFNLDDEFGQSGQLSETALILRSPAGTYAVSIGNILRQQQIVVKPATRELQGRKGIMGTTILGNGKPAVILDLFDMYSGKLKKSNISNSAA